MLTVVFNVDDVTYEVADDGTDTDNDGLTDWEEVFVYGTEKGDPDTDDDGATDGNEIFAGTDPRNILDVFVVTNVEEGEGDMVLRWRSASNRNYSIMIRSNLVHGVESILKSNITANPPLNVYTTTPPASDLCRICGETIFITTG